MRIVYKVRIALEYQRHLQAVKSSLSNRQIKVKLVDSIETKQGVILKAYVVRDFRSNKIFVVIVKVRSKSSSHTSLVLLPVASMEVKLSHKGIRMLLALSGNCCSIKWATTSIYSVVIYKWTVGHPESVYTELSSLFRQVSYSDTSTGQ